MRRLFSWLASWFVRVENPDRLAFFRLEPHGWQPRRVQELVIGDVVKVSSLTSPGRFVVVSIPYRLDQGRYWTWTIDAVPIALPRITR